MLAACWTSLQAQSPPPPPEGDLAVHWEHHNIESGLSGQIVTDAATDSSGFLWVATEKGLNRFDGEQFVPFGQTIGLRQVACMSRDALWLGARGLREWARLDSIPRFNPRFLKAEEAVSLPGITNVHFLPVPEGVWIAGSGPCIHLLVDGCLDTHIVGGDSIEWMEPIHSEPEKGTWFIWHHTVTARGAGLVHLDPDGTMRTGAASPAFEESLKRGVLRWAPDGSVACADGASSVRWFSIDGMPLEPLLGFPSLHPATSFFAENPFTGHVWAMTGDQLLVFNGQNRLLWSGTISDIPDWASHMNRLVFTSASDAWACSNRGVTQFEVNQTGFHTESLVDQLPVGNRHRSLRKLLPWSADTLLFCNDLGDAYIGVRQQRNWAIQPLLDPTSTGLSNLARLPGDSIAFCADGSWHEGPLAGPMQRIAPTGVIDCWSMEALDAAGNAWLLGHNGLTRYDRITRTTEVITASREARSALQDVYAMTELDDGRTLLCTSTGLWAYKDSDRSLEPIEGLPAPLIAFCAVVEDSTWWIGTSHRGLLAYHPSDCTWAQHDRTNGLADSRIYAIQPDGCGHLWLSSDRGIMRFHPASHGVDVFGKREGLHQMEFNRTSWARGTHDRMYFGGLEGFLELDPRFWECQLQHSLADIGLLSLQSFGSRSPTLRNHLSEWARGERIQLPPEFPILTAEFRLLEWGSGVHTYASRVKGHDEHWRESSENTVRLSGFPPGDYQLEIRARFRTGNWSKNALVVPFTVQPTWTQTWAFRVGMGAALLALFIATHDQIKRRRKRLERLVAARTASLEEAVHLQELYLKEVHHRVKNNLQIVGNLLDLQSGHLRHEEAIRSLREGRSRIASIALVHQELHQAGESKSLSLRHAAARLFHLNRSLFGCEGIDATIGFSGTDLNMDLDTSIPMGLILNELITNTFKHGDGTSGRIAVDLHISHRGEGRFAAFYDDHGPGLPEGITFTDEHSLGLWLVSEMVGQLHGKVWVSGRTASRLVWTFKEQNTP